MGEPGNRGQPLLVQGIVVSILVDDFLNVRHGLQIEGAALSLDELQVVGVDAHRVFGNDPFDLLPVDFEDGREVPAGRDAPGKDLLPRVPEYFLYRCVRHFQFISS